MRAIRALAVVALVALDVSAAAAQSTRHFYDSWFWGVKAGGMVYQVESEVVPLDNPSGNSIQEIFGADWLITRKRGGLYASFDYSFFSRDSVFMTAPPFDTVPRPVHLSNLWRLSLAGMFFPLDHDRVHPYVGLGMALSSIVDAEPVGTFSSSAQKRFVEATASQFKAVATPLFIVGTQLRLTRVSVFVQGTAMPANANFFLFTDNGFRATAEAGLRYNIGSSIDRGR